MSRAGAVMVAALTIAAAGCVFGVTTAPPADYRGRFVLTVDTAILSECSLVPGIFGAARNGTCLYLHPGCTNCGRPLAKGSPVTVLEIHHNPDVMTARIRVGAGAGAEVVDRVGWEELKLAIEPAKP